MSEKRFTDEEIDLFVTGVEDMLIEKVDNGTLVSEASFLAGAMTALVKLNGNNTILDRVPVYWVLLPMSGHSVAKAVKEKRNSQTD